MLISGKNKFIITQFTSDEELKQIVLKNPEYFFSPNSFCLTKELISDTDGFEVFTDGFAVDISNRQWFAVHIALSRDNVWSHIAPQVAKKLITAEQSTTKELLIEIVIQQLRKNKDIIKKFTDHGYFKKNEGESLSEIRALLEGIFENSPLVGMPTDFISHDLRNWAATLKAEVKFCIVKKYAENDNSENIIYEIPEHSSSPESIDNGSRETAKPDKTAKTVTHSKNTVTDRLTDKIDISKITY